MNDVILYGDSQFESPYVFSVFVALTEKQIPFQYRAVRLAAKEQHAAAFARTSLTRKVPALEHGDFSLSESSAMIEYLEEVFAPPQYDVVLPTEPRERARARQVMSWLRSDLLPIREERPSETIFRKQPVQPLSAVARMAVLKLFDVAQRLIADERAHIGGRWSIADADLAFMLQRLLANGDDVPRALRGYAEQQWSRASVRDFAAKALSSNA